MRDRFNRLRRTLIRGTSHGWAFMDQGVVSLCNFVSILLLARFMASDSFGLFVLVHTILLFATALQHATLTQAHNVLAPKLRGYGYRVFTAVLFKLQVGAALILAGVSFVISVAVGAGGFVLASKAVLGLALSIVPWLVQDAIRRVLYTKGRSMAAFLNDSISYGIQCGAIIIVVSTVDSVPIMGVFAILSASSAIASILGVYQLRHSVFFVNPRSDLFLSRAREIWSFSRFLSLSEILRWFGHSGHTWLIGIMVGIAPVGAFKAVLHLANVLNPIKLATMAYLPSKASDVLWKRGPDDMHGWLIRTGALLLIPYALVAIALSVFANPLIHAAYGGKYDGVGLNWILVLGAVIHVLSFIHALIRTDMIVLGRTPQILRESVISVGLVMTVGVGCVHFGGLIGAPVSQIFIVLVISIYNLSVLRGELPFMTWFRMIKPQKAVKRKRRPSTRLCGYEADIEPIAGGLVRKHFNRSSREQSVEAAHREFNALTRLSGRAKTGACVEFPSPQGLDKEGRAVIMTRQPGVPLCRLLAETPLTSTYLENLGKRLADSIRYVTRLLDGPYMDFSAQNVLLDIEADRLTFLDFGEAQWNEVDNIQGRPVETAVGHFVGNLLTRLSNPKLAGNTLARRQFLAVASALMAEIMSSESREIAVKISRVIHDKYRLNAWQGGAARRTWYASVGEIGYRMNRRRLLSPGAESESVR